MIEKLKFMIDQTEHNPKLKSLMLKVAEMPEDKQEDTLKLMEIQIKESIKNRQLIEELQKALIEKEEKGQLSPEIVKRLK